MKLTNIQLDGVDHNDSPDFVDAFIISADHENGTPLTDIELDEVNNNYPDVVYQAVIDLLY